MQWVLLAIATIAAVELVLRLDIAGRIRRLLTVVRKVLRVAKSNTISDHWKERAMLAYAGQMLVASLTLLTMFFLVLSPLAIAVAVGAWMSVPLLALLMGMPGVLACILIACVYLPLRRRLQHV